MPATTTTRDLRSVLTEDELLFLFCHTRQLTAAVSAHPCPPAEWNCARVRIAEAVTMSDGWWDGAPLENAVGALRYLTRSARAFGVPEDVVAPVEGLLGVVQGRAAVLAA